MNRRNQLISCCQSKRKWNSRESGGASVAESGRIYFHEDCLLKVICAFLNFKCAEIYLFFIEQKHTNWVETILWKWDTIAHMKIAANWSVDLTWSYKQRTSLTNQYQRHYDIERSCVYYGRWDKLAIKVLWKQFRAHVWLPMRSKSNFIEQSALLLDSFIPINAIWFDGIY